MSAAPATPTAAPARTTVVIVTGLSGAGKTTALHTLEDLGFFCVDNLPTVLAPRAVSVCEDGGMTRVALGMDVRVRSFITSAGKVLSELSHRPVASYAGAPPHPGPPRGTEEGGEGGEGERDVHVIFLDASDESLLHRFSESRRPHPLTAEATEATGAIAVLDGVRLERERLSPMRAQATHVYDTTHLSVHELRRALIAHFGPAAAGAPRMLTRIVSFGFKYGTPVDADLVLDVRFLENPYFIKELSRLPGTDARVRSFVLGLPEAQEFLNKTGELLTFMLPKYEREGKSYLTIGIGCTGGRHRSVVLADALAGSLAHARRGEKAMPDVTVVHRDVTRGEAKHAAETPAEDAESERTSNTELKGVVSPALSTAITTPSTKGGS